MMMVVVMMVCRGCVVMMVEIVMAGDCDIGDDGV
jgi:hypothetical protein